MGTSISCPGFSVTPSADLLYVNTGSLQESVQYTIYNIAGQELIRGAATAGNRFAVNIHSLSRGIYFIRLQSPGANRSIEFLR